MKKLLVVLLVPAFVFAGCQDDDNDTYVTKKRYVTVVEPAQDVVVEVSCTCLCHDHEDNDGHDDHFVPPGHRR